MSELLGVFSLAQIEVYHEIPYRKLPATELDSRLVTVYRPVGRGMAQATPTFVKSKPESTVGHLNFWRKEAFSWATPIFESYPRAWYSIVSINESLIWFLMAKAAAEVAHGGVRWC